MQILNLIIFFLLGTLLGSFFTVVGLRLPKDEDFIKTRSHCDNCNHPLNMLDMVPIFSYIFLRGKCRYCGKKIDVLSTLIELFTGLMFAACYYSFGFTYEALIGFGVISLLMIVAVSDFTYLIISDEVLIFFSLYFMVLEFLRLGFTGLVLKIISGIFLFSLMYLIMIIGNKVLHKESLGGGDIKMMFLFGLVLDPLLGTFSIFLGSFIALPVSIIIMLNSKERQIPFGPFLLIALAIIYFTKISPSDIINFIRGI